MATLVTPPSPVDDPRTFGTDKYIFWTLPLDIIVQAGWYKLVGFGMVRMRLLSLLWGLVAIGAWSVILTKLGADVYQRFIALALIALDYAFIRAASEGRMDMMTAALGFLGIAVFLGLEAHHYSGAIFWAAVCTGASAFTHPVGGALATAGLGVTILWYSQSRFRWWHPGLAAIPYLLLFGAWGIYILQAPDIFRRQLLSMSGSRLGGWAAPLSAVSVEMVQRWAKPFGLIGPVGLRQIRGLVLFALLCGLVWGILRFKRLSQDGFGLVVIIAVLNLVLLCFVDATKNAAYLVYVLPWMGACLALLLAKYWQRGGAIILGGLLLIQLSGTAYIVSRREYQRDFLPAVEAVQSHGGKVTGEGQLGFALGFGPWLIDDRRLGYYSKLPTSLFAMSPGYESFLGLYVSQHPEIHDYIAAKIARSRLVFQSASYKIYQDPAASQSTAY